MTIIICDMDDCVFNNRKSKHCRADALGIEQTVVNEGEALPTCDSYYPTPEQLEPILNRTDKGAK